MKNLYLVGVVLFTFIFCLTIVFKTKPLPPKENFLYTKFQSEKSEITWMNKRGGWDYDGVSETMEYYDVFRIQTWDEYEAGLEISKGNRLDKYNYEHFKDSNNFSGIITKERIFVKGSKTWEDAIFFGVWNLNLNSTINVEWIAGAGGGYSGIGWFHSVYGVKHSVESIALSGQSTFKPVLLKDNVKAYSDGYINYIVEDTDKEFSFKFERFIKSVIISFIVGKLMHKVQILQLEAQERKARTKREAQERKARTKREAQERKARTKRKAQEREARTKREAQEREARTKRKKDLIDKYGDASGNKVFNKEIWIDMTKEMLIDSWGKPEDTKEDISRNKVKLRWYYGGRATRQATTAYRYEVRLENDIVEGWKELE